MTNREAPPLIAVIGPVDRTLLDRFIAHYRHVGVERFLLAFHAAEDRGASDLEELLTHARSLGIVPQIIDRGPWHQDTNARIRDHIRRESAEMWHLIADSDEFSAFEVTPREMIDEAESRGAGTVRGILLDRLGRRGSLDDRSTDFDRAFPIGGFFTHHELGGDPRKVVLAHHDVMLSTGNHRSLPSEEPGPWIIPVHHFKWRAGVLDLLTERSERFKTGEWGEHSPAIRVEIARLISHLRKNSGTIWLDPRASFGPVSVTSTPPDWDKRARDLIAHWKPRGYDFPEE